MSSRLVDFSHRVYDRMRHRQAFEVAGQAGQARDFEALRDDKYCLLVTFRRSGEAVPTPVWFGLANGRLYVHTGADSAKVRRIRNDAHVRVAPCTVRGKPIGAIADGTARVVPPEEEERAEQALRDNYGLGRRMYEGVVGSLDVDSVYLEVTPA
jgi:uncharacterized protein